MDDLGFQRFWAAFPKKPLDSKHNARLAWRNLEFQKDFDAEVVIRAAKQMKSVLKKLNREVAFWPKASNWLNERVYETMAEIKDPTEGYLEGQLVWHSYAGKWLPCQIKRGKKSGKLFVVSEYKEVCKELVAAIKNLGVLFLTEPPCE